MIILRQIGNGLLDYLACLEENNWPVGSDFECDLDFATRCLEGRQYLFCLDGIARHIEHLNGLPKIPKQYR